MPVPNPCFQPEIYSTMPRLGGVVVDPARIENHHARREYTEAWRSWCAGKLPHEIPSYINHLFREESRLSRGSNGNTSGDWE